ncbi:uncharacterized protein LOC129761374 [Toxorhynchites rutilus septentrionalis]|uniref:uncharacterized protein LOC129761374 n=1 Tax=Toxorhynchites rutilus septentrionalis TaxID=329112 RepID=UPI00247A7CD6|nr:uncharacterized protein LOC129761374 [Toxorhynchites rutilus septentrionalis]
MHTFMDGGDNGFAAAVFLRFEEGDQVECSLVSAKTRVAPLKYLSTPRCELQGAVLGVRLANSITKSLTITVSKRYFWTDSRNLQCWLNSDHRRYSPYVGCRISEILDSTNLRDWRYVPSKKNVADDGTKWERIPDVSTGSRWFIGPDFLRRSEQEWPRAPFTVGTTDLELRPHLLLHCEAFVRIIPTGKYSNWKKLQRITAFVLRFIRNLRKKIKGQSYTTGPLEQFEIVEATNLLYREAQMDCYCDEIALLRNRQTDINVLLPKGSPIFRVAPYIDAAGVLRSRTRIQACDHANQETKNPVILPPAHHTTHLVMQHYHEQKNHINHTTVINELRLRYSISRLNSTFRKVRSNCHKCKIERAKVIPLAMADLPHARLAAFARPFSYIGIDYFGPMLVVVRRRTDKRWGVLIPCLTTRAIHIEIAHTLNTGSCIMALRRFISRRGIPIDIYSDRGTNFQGASKELSILLESVNQERMLEEFVNENTTWKFIPPGSPHMGAAWERLVQSVKRNLQQLKLPRLPSDEVLNSEVWELLIV